MNSSHQTNKIKDAILQALQQIEPSFCFNVASEFIQNQEKLVVNAREIHEQLGVKTEFRAWINRRLSEYNFVENQDFLCRSNLIASKSQSPKARNQTTKEYLVTLNTAKELCMVERTDQGRKVRIYFIQLEEKIVEILTQNNKEYHKNSDEKYIAPIEDTLAVAESVARVLRVSDTSYLNMTEKICKIYQVDSSFLPVYVEQNPTQSLTNLLKQFNIKKSAHEVNLLLEKFGIIEQKQRVSTKTPDRIKQFWIFTQKGLEFGINLASPKNQRETSPHYFIEKFKELSKLIATT